MLWYILNIIFSIIVQLTRNNVDSLLFIIFVITYQHAWYLNYSLVLLNSKRSYGYMIEWHLYISITMNVKHCLVLSLFLLKKSSHKQKYMFYTSMKQNNILDSGMDFVNMRVTVKVASLEEKWGRMPHRKDFVGWGK